MIKLENVSKVYKGDVVALRNITCEIQKGEFVFLVGPSGSGKSTFMRLLNKEENPDNGVIYVAGKDIGRLSGWRVPFFNQVRSAIVKFSSLLSGFENKGGANNIKRMRNVNWIFI